MREHLGFLKISSAVVKIAAWIFLLMGVLGAILVFLKQVPGKTALEGVLNLVISIFFFFFLFLVAKIADLLIKIIKSSESKKE